MNKIYADTNHPMNNLIKANTNAKTSDWETKKKIYVLSKCFDNLMILLLQFIGWLFNLFPFSIQCYPLLTAKTKRLSLNN